MNAHMYSSRNASALGIPDLSVTAFGGEYPPFARKQMVKALGVKPEKSKGLGAVISIAASIALPMAAPAIASSIGLSTSLAGVMSATAASTISSALVGAGLGAVSALVTKQKLGQSMLMGAVSGGISGYMQSPNIAGVTTNATAAPSVGQSQVGIANLGDTSAIVTPVQGVNGTQWTVMNGANAGTVVPSNAVGFGGNISNTDLSAILSGGGDQAAQVQSLANTLSSSGINVNVPNAMGGGSAGLQTTQFYDPTRGAAVAQQATPGSTDFWRGTNTAQATPAYQSAGVQVSPAAQQAATASGGLAPQQGGSVWDVVKARVSDPKAQADIMLRAAGQIAGSLTAGSGMSPEQEELVKQQKAELAYLQQTNKALFDQRLREATNLLGEAKYFDPEYFGLQAQRGVTTTIGRQAQENLRELAPRQGGLRTAEQRRYNLEAASRGETAYLQGATQAQQNKIMTTQAGLAALPAQPPGTYTGSSSGYATTLADLEKQRRLANEDMGALFGTVTGPTKATSMG